MLLVGEIKSWEKHPNADRLRIVEVNLGDQIIGPVVCGADNFDIGDKVVLALPGAELPRSMRSDEPFTLEKAVIRGIESQGMLCAAYELGLTDDPKSEHGIMILNKNTQIGSEFISRKENMQNKIVVKSDKEEELHKDLEKRSDADAERIRRYLEMRDLSRDPKSPINEMVERILAIPDFKDFDIIEVPEIVPADISFDLFDFPKDHPARSASDTYYVNKDYILRTHTTVMWYYYLQNSDVKKRMSEGESVGSFSYGKVYRKDEIDRSHMNVFHQIDGWYLAPKEKEKIGEEELKEVLANIAKAVFGENVKYRFNPDTFPYTDPSIEMEIDKNGEWLEALGSGVVKGSVLEKFGIDSSLWNGWAFGFGLERLAMISMELPDIRLLWSDDPRVTKQLNLGQKFEEVSKFPPVIRDISFIVDKDFIPNDYFDLVREIGGDLVEEVKLIDKYENAEKFGPDKVSYTYRVFYRSLDRTLEAEEIEPIHDKLYKETEKQFNAETR